MPEPNNIIEVWLPVPGYEGLYQVSHLGRVRQARGEYRVLSPDKDRFGYRRVILSKCGIKKRWLVHLLVLLAFVGTKPKDFEANHKDGDKENNSFQNLEYMSRSENKLHRYRVLGQRSAFGSRHGRSKLTEAQVMEMRDMRFAGSKLRAIADKFSVCVATVSLMCKGRTWKDSLLQNQCPPGGAEVPTK